MIAKEQILDSIQFVVNNSKYVRIKEENIEKVINLLKESKQGPLLISNYLDLKKYSENQILIYMILCESLNFCYWDSEIEWKIEYKGEWYSGTFGLFYSISKRNTKLTFLKAKQRF